MGNENEYDVKVRTSMLPSLTRETLYTTKGLASLDAAFCETLKAEDSALFNRLMTARSAPDTTDPKSESTLMVDLAPHVEDFIGNLFGITEDLQGLTDNHYRLSPIFRCKRLFVQRYAVKKCPAKDAEQYNGEALRSEWETISGKALTELSFAEIVTPLLDHESENEAFLLLSARYASWATFSAPGKSHHKDDVLFRVPGKMDPENPVHVETEVVDGVTRLKIPSGHERRRKGFALTDEGGSLKQALDEANYCIHCHHQGKDSCSKGMTEKDGSFKKNAAGVTLAGCPLEEHISEMHQLKSAGLPLAALAAVAVNNPLCAATGHRICNDCMKGCIYQKQQPVNIPLHETRTLTDILNLPYGFEIYSLLTRWNPLNIRRPVPLPASGRKVLVAGMGPAGMNLSHHLLNDGHLVVAVDGLKLEPLPSNLSGVTAKGTRVAFDLIRDISTVYADLAERPAQGFGGVAEYGITVRWNKNFLTVLRLLLERREHFSMYGGIRFGGTVTAESAFAYGFDHIALCLGAGKPVIPDMENGMANGVRSASDFLMALQLTGAARTDSIANLQLRLPVLVIGGGLTAVDTATEALAYYPVQVEKFLTRYEALSALHGEEHARLGWTSEEQEIADEWLLHARALREERTKPNGGDPISLLNAWGGSCVVYRRSLTDSPACRLNHEEIELALQEGIRFIPDASPLGVLLDASGRAKALRVKLNGEEKILPARSIFAAAGTQPNTVLAREDAERFVLDGKYFRAIDDTGAPVKPEPGVSKPREVRVFLHKNHDGRFISFFGDLHPSFVGNVVKAMGAAKQGYPAVTAALLSRPPAAQCMSEDFFSYLDQEWRAEVVSVARLTPTIVEVTVKAPAAARAFMPGQFYRLQNFEREALRVTDPAGGMTVLASEGLALTGASADKERGLLSTIVLEMGGSSDLCAHLRPGEPVVLMGPTGAPTETPGGETVLLFGGGLGNAVLFSIGRALRAAGSRVLYVAGYKKMEDRYKTEEIEAASDVIVWACDEGAFPPERPQDRSFQGNIIQAAVAYASGALGSPTIPLSEVNRIIAIGSDRMMQAVAEARRGTLKPYLKPHHEAVGSINSPMQCMMKEICAQCLQRHVDPVSGAESYVFSCFNQDQDLDKVDFSHLRARLGQNSVQEKLTAKWIKACTRNTKSAGCSVQGKSVCGG